MMGNMDLYDKLRSVPSEAKKPITGGRLKGFTDINPMWRIKVLTEAFGACGFGWWYKITDKHLEAFGDEIRAFVDIEMFVVVDGKVSQPICGTGGATFVTMEKNSGIYVSDECFKMALTDAISVAAKSLGVGADVYYEKDRDKYTCTTEESKTEAKPKKSEPQTKAETTEAKKYYCSKCGKEIEYKVAKYSWDKYGSLLCRDCQNG